MNIFTIVLNPEPNPEPEPILFSDPDPLKKIISDPGGPDPAPQHSPKLPYLCHQRIADRNTI
jgi:hypothetical protein